MLNKKLTTEEQREILNTLFGFTLRDYENDGHFILYNGYGDEFYGITKNCGFDFSTLSGIFSYTEHMAKNQGYSDAQYNVRKALGLK